MVTSIATCPHGRIGRVSSLLVGNSSGVSVGRIGKNGNGNGSSNNW